jgi:hypothetical protein
MNIGQKANGKRWFAVSLPPRVGCYCGLLEFKGIY